MPTRCNRWYLLQILLYAQHVSDNTVTIIRSSRVLYSIIPSVPRHTDNLKTKAPNTTGSDHLYNTLELLMMGIVLPETCWACNKICNKYHLLHLVDILIPHNHTTCSTHFHHIQNMCGSGNIHSAELLRAAGIIARIQSPWNIYTNPVTDIWAHPYLETVPEEEIQKPGCPLHLSSSLYTTPVEAGNQQVPDRQCITQLGTIMHKSPLNDSWVVMIRH